MRTIIRCPNCFTYVYSDARRCHGCGQKVGHRKILTRGSWIFALLAVTGFTLARGIDLQQDKRSERAHQIELAAQTERLSSFLRTWLGGSTDEVGAFFKSGKPFAGELLKLRAKYPNVLPATPVGRLKIEEKGTVYHQQKTPNGPVAVVDNSQYGHPALRASRVPSGREDRRFIRSYSWWPMTYDFEAEVSKDGINYTVHGAVCVSDGGSITCLSIDRIESIEGVVPPQN